MAFDVFREPIAKLVMRVEKRRHNKMQQSPKLLHIVLNRCTCEQESITAVEPEQALPS